MPRSSSKHRDDSHSLSRKSRSKSKSQSNRHHVNKSRSHHDDNNDSSCAPITCKKRVGIESNVCPQLKCSPIKKVQGTFQGGLKVDSKVCLKKVEQLPMDKNKMSDCSSECTFLFTYEVTLTPKPHISKVVNPPVAHFDLEFKARNKQKCIDANGNRSK